MSRTTARRAAAFYRDFERRADSEAAFLRSVNAVRPSCSATSRRSRMPAARARAFRRSRSATSRGTGSTTATRRFERDAPGVIQTIRDGYGLATRALRLPMHGGFASMADIVDIPMIARRSTRSRDETRRVMHIPGDRPVRARVVRRLRPGHPVRRDRAPRAADRALTRRGAASRRSPTRISSPPPTSSSPSPATASSRSAWPTARRCSTRRAAGSSNTTCSSPRCRASCAAASCRRTICSRDAGARTSTHCSRSQIRPNARGSTARSRRGAILKLTGGCDRRLTNYDSLTQVTSDQIRGMFTFSIDTGLRSAWARNAGRSRSDLKPRCAR